MDRPYILTRAERETTFTKADDERSWHLFTESPAMIARLRKAGWLPEDFQGSRVEIDLPAKALKVRPRNALVVSPGSAKEAILRERMARMRAAQQAKRRLPS